MTKTTIYYHSTKEIGTEDIKVAGNFTNWSPHALQYNEKNKNYEYHVNTNQAQGKLLFKFVIDGKWVTNENYSSEFDEAGNENNVILYDSRVDPADVDKEVREASDNEPRTPDPTPRAIPTATKETVPNTANVSKPLITEAPAPFTTKGQSTTASKANDLITKKPSRVVQSESEALKGSTTEPETASSTKPAVPAPEPVARPTPPSPTQVGEATTKEVPPPQPVSRPTYIPQIPDVEDEDYESAEYGDDLVEQSGSHNHNDSLSKKGVSAHFGLGFFAVILQAISQFFRSWFTPAGNQT